MGSTPTVCADDLLTIFGFFKKYLKSRSVNIFSAAGFSPKQYKRFTSQSSAYATLANDCND